MLRELTAAPVALFLYAYAAYPAVLHFVAARRRRDVHAPRTPDEWPLITIVVVAHNAEHLMRRTLQHLIEVDYPADRRQILVVSDGSTDATVEVAREFADRGVEVHALEGRRGKTAAENAVAGLIRGEIVVSTDATLIVDRTAVKALVRHFADPSVGVVSGRGVSTADMLSPHVAAKTAGEARYLDYETWVRSLESASLGRIAGATGQLYAQRRELYRVPLTPTFLTRDFASALIAHERGYKSIQENDARCFVARNACLRREYERKARTIVLGLDTLFHYRQLLDPARHGWFAVMLLSHKVCRWLVYLLAPVAFVSLVLLAGTSGAAWAALVGALGFLAVGLAAIYWPARRRVPALLAACGFAVTAATAGLAGWLRFFRGEHATVWKPTERAPVTSGGSTLPARATFAGQ